MIFNFIRIIETVQEKSKTQILGINIFIQISFNFKHLHEFIITFTSLNKKH